jgi:hypothetical protein
VEGKQLLESSATIAPPLRIETSGTKRRNKLKPPATWRQANENFLITELISATAIKKRQFKAE